jgi:hypothetical protein
MSTLSRATAALGLAVSLGILLGGCALLESGPGRDDTGRVTGTAEIPASELLTGDCFRFDGADRGAKPVTVTPCGRAHEFRAIQRSSVSAAEVTKAGSLQDAMSVLCRKAFAEYRQDRPENTDAQLQFLVFSAPESSSPERPDSSSSSSSKQRFTCITSEGPIAATGTPTPAATAG